VFVRPVLHSQDLSIFVPFYSKRRQIPFYPRRPGSLALFGCAATKDIGDDVGDSTWALGLSDVVALSLLGGGVVVHRVSHSPWYSDAKYSCSSRWIKM
jgi:hypothetical protein